MSATKVSKYKQRILRQRANAGCEMFHFITDKWRKHYCRTVAQSKDEGFDVYNKLLAEADKLASKWDREYKEAAGILPLKDDDSI